MKKMVRKLKSYKIQKSFSDMEYDNKKRKTRKEIFLERMEQLIPWKTFIALIEPYYPKAGPKGGRPTIGLEKMLRMYFVQNWFDLSDEATEDAMTETMSIRHFVGVSFGYEEAPDAITLLHFRRILETNGLCNQIFIKVNELLVTNGLTISKGTIVDETIIEAASSTKNEKKKRDPEMHQTKKGNQWFLGMKAHIGVDAKNGIVHTLTATAANTHDITDASN
jgi:IS5 family transposase